MKIAIGSDHAGFQVKESLKKFLAGIGLEVIDMGTHNEESCDYPDFAKKVAQAISTNQCEKGVLICGTGIGMSITANKFKNVRAALVCNEYTAEMSRKHNDSNVFCTGARVFKINEIEKMLRKWLETQFEGERHQKRIDKIETQ